MSRSLLSLLFFTIIRVNDFMTSDASPIEPGLAWTLKAHESLKALKADLLTKALTDTSKCMTTLASWEGQLTEINSVCGWSHHAIYDQALSSVMHNDSLVNCPPSEPLVAYGNKFEHLPHKVPIRSSNSTTEVQKQTSLSNDGTKFLCQLNKMTDPSNCVIMSIGSQGETSFEKAMLSETSCRIFTLDCTFNGSSIDPRHMYKMWCLGMPKPGSHLEYLELHEIMKRLDLHRLDVLKVDIEGHEYDVFADLAASVFKSSGTTSWLPRQIVVEVHAGLRPPGTTPGQVNSLILTFAMMGYIPIARDDNFDGWGCCSELTFIRVSHNPWALKASSKP